MHRSHKETQGKARGRGEHENTGKLTNKDHKESLNCDKNYDIYEEGSHMSN